MKNILSLLLFVFGSICFLQAQDGGIETQNLQDRDAVFAREEFRRGVQAYNRYAYNEAIYSFERALSFKPQESLILDWLGKAYYKSGLEDTALRQWQSSISLMNPRSEAAILLNSRMETVRNRRSLLSELDSEARYVEAGIYPGKSGDISLYRQPTSLLPLNDGSVWVVAYGSNEIVNIDVNGIVRRRIRGPINGFDRPYDIAEGLDGRLYVSEYRGGRVSVLDKNGEWLFYIGSKGYGEARFVGAQNLCTDSQGYLYVVDFGTRTVSKFTPDGEFLLSFGARQSGFQGLKAPTGIAEKDGIVYVADGRQIHRFDRSGNYLGLLVSDDLYGPESLRFTLDGKLLVADTNRILLIDVETMLVKELGSIHAGPVRLVCADTDRNGNLLAANFQAGEVSVMSRMDDISAGLFVQIERIVSDNFPELVVEVQVQDRRRRPIVGLQAANFLVSEKGQPAAQQEFLGAAHNDNTSAISIMIERSPETSGRSQDIYNAVRDSMAVTDTLVSMVSAAEQPLEERIDNADAIAASVSGSPSLYSPNWNFDLALRLAASDLLPYQKKRAVIFVSSGQLGPAAFERYALSELSAYLANNDIRFYAVTLTDGPVDQELHFLCEQSGGSVLNLYRPQGIGEELAALRHVSSGIYQLRYTSMLPSDFGRSYLPVELEVYLLDRSGRDATGYFPPLE